MENSNLDDTKPRNVKSDAQEAHDLNETRPISTPAETDESVSVDATRPVPVKNSNEDPEPYSADQPSTPEAYSQSSPSDVEETMPPPGVSFAGSTASQIAPPDQFTPDGVGTKSRRPSWRRWTLYGLLALVLIASISAFLGYSTGINDRRRAEREQTALRVEEQYQLGLQDMEAQHYDLARQRFEYVIQLNPNYPGVTDKLAEVLMRLNATATPTVEPTPTITPTPDLRGVEELFQQAQVDLANYAWSTAINTLLALRKADPNYQPVWVDDMLYVSFRNRGADKILKEGDLEGGMYDLSLAEQFGPLDAEASGYLTWARLYVTGASFWELDWSQAVYYFAQVAPALPNLRDGSGWTATERYRLALIGYGGQLADADEWCAAVEQYELALTFGDEAEVREALDIANQKCGEAEGQPEPPPQDTVTTPTATGGVTPVATQPAPTETTLPDETPTQPTPEPSPTPGS